MLRRSSLRLHNLLSGCSHGISAKSPFPGASLADCGSAEIRHFLNPVGTVSPIQSTVSQCLRQYSSKPKKEYREVNLACPEDIERLKQYLVEAEQEREERRKAKANDPNASESESDDEPEIRYEDYEQELKIFEDPFLDRKPPPEPDEQTKKDVAEMIEALKQLVDKMPMQKPSKKRQGRGNKGNDGNKTREKVDDKQMQATRKIAKIIEDGLKMEDDLPKEGGDDLNMENNLPKEGGDDLNMENDLPKEGGDDLNMENDLPKEGVDDLDMEDDLQKSNEK